MFGLPVQLIICIVLVCLFGNLLSLEVVRFLLAISNAFKEILIFCLPIIVFSYISSAMMAFKRQAPWLLLGIFSLVIFSNALAAFVAYFIGNSLIPVLVESKANFSSGINNEITPLFVLQLKQVLSNDKMMIIGICIALLSNKFNWQFYENFVNKCKDAVTWGLCKLFIPILPIYIVGFLLKIQHEGNLVHIVSQYINIFALTCSVIIFYIMNLYFIASHANFGKMKENLKNMWPAWLTGFSTMSSTATMPLTLQATEKNLKDKELARLIIPTTTNIHMLGDALGIPLLALGVIAISGGAMPDFFHYSVFVFSFCLAKFSGVGVPGGTILIMLPVLQQYLFLDASMSSLITTLYILQDPIFTSSSVLGNGAFALLYQKMIGCFNARRAAS